MAGFRTNRIVFVGQSDRYAAAIDDAGFDVSVVGSATDCLNALESDPADGVVSRYAPSVASRRTATVSSSRRTGSDGSSRSSPTPRSRS
jgi:hypothetical protein